MSYLLYVLAVSVLVTLAAWALERALQALGRPIRWVWVVAMAATAGLSALVVVGVLPLQETTPEWSSNSAESEARVGLPSGEDGAVSGLDEAGRTRGGLRSALALPGTFLNRALGGLQARAASVVSRFAGPSNSTGGVSAASGGAGPLPAGALLVFGMGSSAVLLLLVVAHLRLYMRRRRWGHCTVLETPVRLSGEFGPAVVGVRRPEVVLPRTILRLPRKELGLVLRHEVEHVQAGDTRLLAGALLPLVLAPWNPLVWLQLFHLRQAVELDCDARVLRSGVPASSYARTLLTLSSSERPGLAPSPALTAPSRHLKRRIRSMKTSSLRSRIPTGLAASGLALLFVVLACEVEPPTAETTSEAGDAAHMEVLTGEAEYLEGKVAGARIVLRQDVDVSSGEPEGRMRISGESQGDEDERPLVVVNGVPGVELGGASAELDASNIESVEVLRGAAAVERYGERARHGVILIKTRN
ncbi:MAG: M56 family peptidase [Gemmatimonadales bacterium]|nr:MAG: M56 family peptidase [Gemmatimonadales bacterium]